MDTTQPVPARPTDLEGLAAALDPQEFATTLVTGEGRTPRLTVANRRTHTSEDVYVEGDWYWYPWAERIAPVGEVERAARKVADMLCSTVAPIQPDRPFVRDQPAAPPNIARLYSFWAGGKDHLAADRQAAGEVVRHFPEVAAIAKANRQFVTRAVAHAAGQGITQFVDIGAGLPAWPAVHQTARDHQPAARTAYLDNDPVVLAHARALYAAPGVAVIPADLRHPTAILADQDLHALIDFTQPVCLILAAVLHFLHPAEADHAVRVLTAPLAPGSYLVISAGTSTGTDPALVARLRAAYARTAPVSARTQTEIAAWFTGFSLIRPGLADVRDWRPSRLRPGRPRTPSAGRFLAGVGAKTHPSPVSEPARGLPGGRRTAR